MTHNALLVLEDGTVFRGRSIGAAGETFGELVFNTGMTGYQEVLTDPSYCGQIVVMTYPEVGIYGINPDDVESWQIQVAGYAVHRAVREPFNQRATQSFTGYLEEAGIVSIEGIDTRKLTRHLRTHGAQRGVISTIDLDPESLIRRVKQSPQMAGLNLAKNVTPAEVIDLSRKGTSGAQAAATEERFNVALIDTGRKENIARDLMEHGCHVTVVPYNATLETVLDLNPDGVFVCNGPGDPEPLEETINLVRGVLERQIPLAGICLGNQILGLALGGKTYKMRFGHRGINHPVRDFRSERILITTQNHGFAVDPTSLGVAWEPLDSAFEPSRPEVLESGESQVAGRKSASGQVASRQVASRQVASRQVASRQVDKSRGTQHETRSTVTMAELLPQEPLVGESPLGFGKVLITHLSLNDGTMEGLKLLDLPAFSVQYHPEAAPGPHDAKPFFGEFIALMNE